MTNMIKATQTLVAAAFLIFVFAAWVNTPALALADTCTGIAIGPSNADAIKCGGDCETNPDQECKNWTGKDADGDYQFCACENQEPACCHMIVRGSGDTKTIDHSGVCLTSLGCAQEDALKCEVREEQVNCYEPKKPGQGGGPITQGGS